nr:uncharacterized protein LOC109166813 [Ipomoea batatas]GMD98788.1 uncharacterized protein LOC109166813 [Ipomoea batatas]
MLRNTPLQATYKDSKQTIKHGSLQIRESKSKKKPTISIMNDSRKTTIFEDKMHHIDFDGILRQFCPLHPLHHPFRHEGGHEVADDIPPRREFKLAQRLTCKSELPIRHQRPNRKIMLSQTKSNERKDSGKCCSTSSNLRSPSRTNPLIYPFSEQVTVPKGSLCNLNVKVNVGLPPDAVYNIVTDPENKRVFKNIQKVISRKVLLDEGPRQVVELEQAAMWKFLWWSGTISVHVLVDQNREDHSMNFKQVKTGFMKRFEGCWRVEPLLVDEELCHPYRPNNLADYVSYTKGKGRIGSKVSLEQLIQPALVPPPPISWYVRGITTKTTEMIINDLQAETARIRRSSSTENLRRLGLSEESSGESQTDSLCNIKERWALKRRKARNRNRRHSFTGPAK